MVCRYETRILHPPNYGEDKLKKSKIHLLFFYFTLIFSLSLASCTKDNPTAPPPLPLPPSTSGSWSGMFTFEGVTGPFSLTLSQEVISISGNGALGSLTLSISGENHYPDLTFSCGAIGYKPFTFTGQFTSPTAFSGLINGSGFINATVAFTKD